MPIVVSQGTLTDVGFWEGWPRDGAVRMSATRWMDYAALYRSQENVRICVDFLARNIAQLGLHVFCRVSDTDRQRLMSHPLAQLIGRPNPFTTRYRFVRGLMSDLGIYDEFFALKIRASDLLPDEPGMALLRIPPYLVNVEGGLVPTLYKVNLGNKRLEAKPSEILHLHGYSPESDTRGVSPLETLRRTLAEETATSEAREDYWNGRARMSGIITRPIGAPVWSGEGKEQFRAQFESMFGRHGGNVGGTAIFEEGMGFQTIAFNPEQSQYVEGRKLDREEVARAYHIPLPMVGILDHATFSNVRAQHEHLYQDCLGPWLEMIEEEFDAQLLSEFEDRDGIYVEFNVAAKLAGTPDEQLETLIKATGGRAVLTQNEARARLNLPALEGDADKLGEPLNVQAEEGTERLKNPPANGSARAELETRTLERQRGAIARRLSAGFANVDEAWDEDRWNRELTLDLAAIGEPYAAAIASEINDRHRALLVAEMEA